LEAYRAGAWEFLGQPLDGEALLLKLNTFLQCKREVDALREENLLDPGSGLYNMRGLSRRAREIGAEAFRRRDPVACVVFAPDIDQDDADSEDVEARRMSDQVALLFRQAGRASDAIGRLGPAEYGVIAPATGPEAAVRMVRRLGGAIESSPIPVRGGEKTLKLRAGYCAVPDFAESSVDAVELLLRATTALRDLKREGQKGERIRSFEQVPTNFAN
jgi:diguanylate cyclase (GGDEF)-like protein